MFKRYLVVRTTNQNDVLEEFHSEKAAQDLVKMLRERGEDVSMITKDDDIVDDGPLKFELEEGSVVEPEIQEYGSELDDEYGDDTDPATQLFDQNDL